MQSKNILALIMAGACASMASGALKTEWGEKVTAENAWREYPRPQMVRGDWLNLNGRWNYSVLSNDTFGGTHPVKTGEITVPFAIESSLSGVGRLLGSGELLEYNRKFTFSLKKGRRAILRFEAVDYRAQVFVNGVEAGVPHEGGNVPFSYDVTSLVKDGENDLKVRVWDPTDGFVNTVGKQKIQNKGIFYTRVSGIWQTVWIEQVSETYIERFNVVPDIDNAKVSFRFDIDGTDLGEDVEVKVFDPSGRLVAEGEGDAAFPVEIAMPKGFKLWSPESPVLYSFTAEYEDDKVSGYFAMRKFSKEKDAKGVWRFFLNNKPYFIIGTLDQGWWPDGLLTPPSEEAMKYDIEFLKESGFNMMRKHIKVEPRRYYALCDRLGLIVVQDMPSGDTTRLFDLGFANQAYGTHRREWREVMDHLIAVPSIVMWVPYNEQWTQPGAMLTRDTLLWTKRYDPTRLVDGPSGWSDYEGGRVSAGKWRNSAHLPADQVECADVIDMHVYRGPGMFPVNPHRISFLGEFGGLGHPVEGHLWAEKKGNWGYGGINDTKTPEGLEKVYKGLMDKLVALAGKGLAGSVYTQTTDVEIEINGLMTYDRKVKKIDPALLRKLHEKVVKAADAAAKAAK